MGVKNASRVCSQREYSDQFLLMLRMRRVQSIGSEGGSKIVDLQNDLARCLENMMVDAKVSETQRECASFLSPLLNATRSAIDILE